LREGVEERRVEVEEEKESLFSQVRAEEGEVDLTSDRRISRSRPHDKRRDRRVWGRERRNGEVEVMRKRRTPRALGSVGTAWRGFDWSWRYYVRSLEG
jgi:hypothetical protein